MANSSDTTQPQRIGTKLCVRIRTERHDLVGTSLEMWRITNPRGRQRIAGTSNYITQESAALAAEGRGWTVVGLARMHSV